MNRPATIYLAISDSGLTRGLRGRLEGAGHRVQEAMDFGLVGEEVELSRPEVVVLSSVLPDEDEVKLLRDLSQRAGSEHRQLLLLVDSPGSERVAELLAAGASDLAPHNETEAARRAVLLARLASLSSKASEPMISGAAEVDRLEEERRIALAVPGREEIEQLAAGLSPGHDGHYEQDLGLVVDVAEAVASSMVSIDVLYILVRRLSQLIPVHRCKIVLTGIEPEEGLVVASHDDPGLRRLQVDLRRYPEVQRCLRDGRVVLIEDVRHDPEMQEVLDLITGIDLRSALVFPLFVRELPVGALCLTSRREARGFTRRELLVVRTLANLASAALATSELLERVRREGADARPPLLELDELNLGLEDQLQG